MGVVAATTQAYRALLERMAPRGVFFRAVRATPWFNLMSGVAVELARVHNVALDWLLEESDPNTATDPINPDGNQNYGGLLSDWERVLGLPDPECVIEATTVQQRQALAAAKLGSYGGSTAAYLVEVAAAAGFTITIDANNDGPHPWRCGTTGCDEPIYNTEWAWAFIVNGVTAHAIYFRCGTSGCDEPLVDWGNDLLECLIHKLKPAESLPHFVYT